MIPNPTSSPADRSEPEASRPLDELQTLLRLARAGNAEAAQLLYDRYREHVLRVVRRHLSQTLRKVFDSVDLTQDVWKSVFRCVVDGQDFDCPAQFLEFLNAVARNKTLLHHRHEVQAQKRSLAREEPFDEHADELIERAAPGPDPSERVTAEDEWAHLLRLLSERDRSILQALRAGARLEELAQQLGVSVKTLRRFIERCRELRARQSGRPPN